MKKLFTLIAFLTCFLGANSKEVVDAEVNFSDYSDISQVKWGGWGASESALARLSIVDGCLHFESTEATDPSWDCQFHPIGGVKAEVDVTYTLHFKIKGDHAGNVSMLGFGQTPYGQFAITTDWVEGTVDYVCTDAGSNAILMQCGDWIGTWDIAYLKITHEEQEGQKPTAWKESMLDNGDAEKDWPEWAFTDYMEDGVNAAWRSDRAIEICAWGLVRGTNIDPSQTPDPVNDPDGNPMPEGKPRPFPCDIEEVDGNRAFVVHTTAADNQFADWQAWDNQFFIMAPKGFKSGTKFKLHFRYKATNDANTQTQVHHENPSWYLHYVGIGDVKFTSEWQEFDQEVTLSGWSDALGYCIAFNLNAENKEPNDFYIDDITWQEMDLEEGVFVAFKNEDKGIAYNYANAIQFEEGEIDGDVVLVATVGTEGNKDTWVNEVTISTVRGDNSAFKTNALVLDDNFATDTWIPYKAAANKAISLPEAGVWKIGIDTNEGMMYFIKIEGEEPVDPVDVVTNASELVIEGVERDDLEDNWQGQREEAGGTGNTWDNQFFIVATRELQPDEQVIVEFDYYIASDCDVEEAKVTTQSHGDPGAYVGGAIGDLTFTKEPQHFTNVENVWTVEKACKSIAFNMAEIKDACTYVIKNVKWYLKYSEEGKTLGNLIPAEGTDNFWVKIGAGTDPYNWTTGPAPKKADPNINGDETINGQDLQALINAIVAESTDTAKFDITGDGQINGQDLQALINIIVAQE